MRRQRGKSRLAHFTRPIVGRTGVIDHPVRVLWIEGGRADVHHQMIRLTL
jgi:hypothetical protein